jgi:hypothetical protein
MDLLLLAIGFRSQQSNEPKSDDAPSNFWQPIQDNRVEGDFSHIAFRHSAYNWLTRQPVLRGLAIGSAIAALAMRFNRR